MKAHFNMGAVTSIAPTAGFVVGLAMMLFITVLSYRSVDNAVERNSWVEHTEKVKALADDIQSNLMNSEMPARGYIITGEATFIDSQMALGDAIQKKILNIVALTSDNHFQQVGIQQLMVLAKQRIAAGNELIRLQKNGRHAEAVDLVRANSGNASMENIVERINIIKGEENTLLAVRVTESEKAVSFMRKFIVLGDGLAIVLLALTFTVLVRNKARLQQHNDLIERLNEEVTRNATSVEAANNELEAFSYSVSHDLRAPLRAIDGFSQVLIEDFTERLDAKGTDALNRIRAAAQRMGHLIDDLLNLSRVTRANMRHEAVDLSAMAAEVIVEIQNSEPKRVLNLQIEPGLWASGDAQLLRVVLVNLLGNAWKFTGKSANAKIEFGATKNADGATEFFVRDNGAGFDMAYADKLFGAFQRMHLTSEFPGTGIGLATVRRIVHRHGGQVRGVGTPDQGAVFYFTLSG